MGEINSKAYGVEFIDMANSSVGIRTGAAANFPDPVPAINGGTGSSPFDNIMPWSGMTRSTDPNAGEVVAIPKFYFKWTKDGTKLGLQISMNKFNGFNTSPAHADRGDGKGERDIIYVGRYHSCETNNKSTTGQRPNTSVTRSTARTAAHSLGSNVWQFDFATLMTIWMLYLVEFADWNSQAKIGYGCGSNIDDDDSREKTGASDNMQYHTGTMQTNRTNLGVGVQYRYIEDLWGNVLNWVDGCYYSSNGLSIIMNPNNFSDTENGTIIGIPTLKDEYTDYKFVSAFNVSTVPNLTWVIYPSAAFGNSTVGSCDIWSYGSQYPCLYFGGCYAPNNLIGNWYGLFSISCNSTGMMYLSLGFRVIVLP